MPARLWLATLAALLGMALPARGQSLSTLHHMAVSADPALAGAQAQSRAAGERVNQAAAAMGLNVALNASLSRSDHRDTQYPSVPERNFFNRQYTLQVNQPVYRPAAWRAWQQSRVVAQAAVLQADVALAELTQRLTGAFFDVLTARSELEQLRAQLQATQEQLAVASKSFHVGTVSVTDVREAEAKLDTVAAQAAAAELELLARQAALGLIAGGGTANPPVPMVPVVAVPPLALGDLERWLDAAEQNSPQINQARRNLDAARLEVDKNAAGAYPTLDFSLSQQENASSGSTATALPQAGRTLQAGFTLSVPLYASGGINARTREALAQRDRADSELEAARRTTGLTVRQSFYATLAAMAQFKGLMAAERSAETALKANRRGYEVGLRINADVLNAQSQLYQARRDKARAWNEAWTGYIKLKAAAGTATASDLAEIDQLFAQAPSSVEGAP